MAKEDQEEELWKSILEDEKLRAWIKYRRPGWTDLEAQGLIIAILVGMVAILGVSIFLIFT